MTRFIVESRTDVAAVRAGAPAYRILRGHYEGEVDPADRHDAIITDLNRARRLPNGKVAYSATFAIAMPADPKRASGFLWYDVPNRGNGDVAADAGGDIRVVSGWQGDIAPQAGRQTLIAPVAPGLTGPVLQRLTDITAGRSSTAIVGGIGIGVPRPLPTTLDTRRATLTRQRSDSERPTPVAAADWAFADCRTTPFPGTPDPTQLCLRAGFDPGQAYTLRYEGKDPKVLGTGFAAVRDLNSFLRHARADDAGTPNPVAGLVRWSLGTGTSQSGNFLRTFILLGFNASDRGGRVFDGINPNIAGRLLPMNLRFGVPGGASGPFEPGSEGTLWWGRYTDRARGLGTTSLLDRCSASATCPKIVETFGSAEFWGLRMSPDLIGTDAKADIPLPANVRRYYFPSTTHGGSRVGGFPVAGEPRPEYPGVPYCTLPFNPIESETNRRALLKALADWVSTGKEPPASRYPTLAAGDLVPANAAAMGWQGIPGAPTPDGKLNTMPAYDFGPHFVARDLSGVATQPPRVLGTIPQRVPRVNADGNETAGVPAVQLLVPTGTFTGWNVLAKGYGAGEACGFAGGFIPFAKTEGERRERNDHRPSLEARYGTHAGFVARVRTVAAEQVVAGWLLQADADRLVRQAEASAVLRD
ncbi:alpha/beta hydrolase domain-containing protein [Sphingomonas adhaesiva]|uniref:alpha/beta hydrolase domain-containing protein n=1 Tax=Sphingomonas adhaesiva TaxID=28212 RepID=UPI002FFCFA15